MELNIKHYQLEILKKFLETGKKPIIVKSRWSGYSEAVRIYEENMKILRGDYES